MSVKEFKDALIAAAYAHFPSGALVLQERRSIILEARITLEEQLFISVYFNALTGRKNFALIHQGRRIFGYDNRRFWHRHPVENPEMHIRCREPLLNTIFKEMREIVEKLIKSSRWE